MNISTKLKLSSIIIASLVLIFIGVVFILTFKLHQSNDKQQLAGKITETSFQLSLLRGEYLAHRGERPKAQWINIYEEQHRILGEAAHLFVATKEKEFFEDTRRALEDSRTLFGQLIQNIESGNSETVIEELGNQLTFKAQTQVSNALQMADSARQDATIVVQLFELTVTLLALLILGISVWSYLMSRSITKSLDTLAQGTRSIAEGNLDYQLEVKSQNEIGVVSRSFNEMVNKLKESYEGLEEKVRQRTKELDGKVIELEEVNKLMVGRELKMVEIKKENEQLRKAKDE